MDSQIIYDWKFIDKKDRGKLWYVISIALVLGLTIWGILTKQYGLSFIVILATGIYFFVDNNADDVINVTITSTGIGVNDNFYNYSMIKHFYLVYDKNEAVYIKLGLDKKGIKKMDLSINNEVAEKLKQILPNYLSELESEEISFIDKLINYLKL